VRDIDIKNEEKVLNQLSNWIQKQNIKVIQDHKRKSNNLPTFSVKGNQHKPDLIAISYQNTAIEVKTGNGGNMLGTNSGIITYFEKYCDEKTSYFDEKNNQIKIDNFVLATRYSFYGRLKEKEPIHESSRHRERAARMGFIPLKEYEATYEIIRHGIWQQINKDKYRECGVGIGLLLSTALGYIPDHYNWKKTNLSTDMPIPAIQLEKPNPRILNKDGGHRWGFEWKPI